MAATPIAVPTARFGLLDFDAIDTSGRPQLDNEEQLAGDYPGIRLLVGDDGEVGQGHLYISSKRIIWVSVAEPVKGCCATFPTITMHAISQEPAPCIYAQLEAANSESSEEEDDDTYPEIRLIPADSSKLQEIFETLCQCAALNPDSNDDDDSDEGDFFYNEEEVLNGIGAENRAALLERYDALLEESEQPELEELTGEDPDRFADPDDDESPPGATHPSA
ncbi:hypothetical protein ABBQ32_008484 [Trebouxia sp. C0010 RCD-2024]